MIVQLVEALWLEMPDQRLGQLVSNLAMPGTSLDTDVYQMLDGTLVKRVALWANRLPRD